jgi:hypothetical protein
MEDGTDAKPSAEGKLVCTMPRCEGGKALEEGLKLKTFVFRRETKDEPTQRNESRGCLHTMPSRKEEKPAQAGLKTRVENND